MASEWTPSLVTFPLTVSPFVWNRITLTRATITTTTPHHHRRCRCFLLPTRFPILFQPFSLFLILCPYSLACEKPFSGGRYPSHSHIFPLFRYWKKTYSTICLWWLSKIICKTLVLKKKLVFQMYIRDKKF